MDTIPAILRAAAETYGDQARLRRGRPDPHLRRAARPRAGAGPTATSATAWPPGERVVVWGPNSIEWVDRRAGDDLRRRHPGAGQLPLHRSRGGRPRRPHRRRHRDGRRRLPRAHTSSRSCARASDIPSVRALGELAELSLDHRGEERQRPRRDDRRGRGPRRRGRRRRRRRHPLHLRHHRPAQGRDERAPAEHRRRAGLGRARRRERRRPLPGGQPVLPLLRLQDRHHRRACSPAPPSTRSRRSTSTRRWR